jgi:hypothetical protein
MFDVGSTPVDKTKRTGISNYEVDRTYSAVETGG